MKTQSDGLAALRVRIVAPVQSLSGACGRHIGRIAYPQRQVRRSRISGYLPVLGVISLPYGEVGGGGGAATAVRRMDSTR